MNAVTPATRADTTVSTADMTDDTTAAALMTAAITCDTTVRTTDTIEPTTDSAVWESPA